MKKTLIIVADDYSMNVISLTETGKFKIYQNDFLEFELVYLDLKTGKDIILYETRDEEEILEARDYLYDSIKEGKTIIDLSSMDLNLTDYIEV